MNKTILSVDETFQSINFLNNLYKYLKTDMDKTQIIEINKKNIYTHDGFQNKFVLLGEFHPSKTTMKTISWLMNILNSGGCFVFEGDAIFQLKKDVKKSDILDGYVENNKFYIKYVSKKTGEETVAIIGGSNLKQEYKNKINELFDKTIEENIIMKNIIMSYECYDENNGELYINNNKITLNRNDKWFASIPKKFLQKFSKKDLAYFNLYKNNKDMNLTEFVIQTKDYTIRQLFITVNYPVL